MLEDPLEQSPIQSLARELGMNRVEHDLDRAFVRTKIAGGEACNTIFGGYDPGAAPGIFRCQPALRPFNVASEDLVPWQQWVCGVVGAVAGETAFGYLVDGIPIGAGSQPDFRRQGTARQGRQINAVVDERIRVDHGPSLVLQLDDGAGVASADAK